MLHVNLIQLNEAGKTDGWVSYTLTENAVHEYATFGYAPQNKSGYSVQVVPMETIIKMII